MSWFWHVKPQQLLLLTQTLPTATCTATYMWRNSCQTNVCVPSLSIAVKSNEITLVFYGRKDKAASIMTSYAVITRANTRSSSHHVFVQEITRKQASVNLTRTQRVFEHLYDGVNMHWLKRSLKDNLKWHAAITSKIWCLCNSANYVFALFHWRCACIQVQVALLSFVIINNNVVIKCV